MKRKIISVIESQAYSEIIFLIAAEKNYAQIIAQERNTEPSPTVKQLKELVKKGYLKSHQEKNNILNKRIYTINWDKIINDYFQLIIKTLPTIKVKNDYYSNRLFINFLKGIFAEYSHSKIKPYRIKNVFDIFNRSLFAGYVNQGKTQEEKDFYEITQFSEKILNASLNPEMDQFIKIAEKVYDEIKQKV